MSVAENGREEKRNDKNKCSITALSKDNEEENSDKQ